MEKNISNKDINDIFTDFDFKGINTYSPLVLAYIGDVVYELYIRCMIVSEGNMPVGKYHTKSISYVKAKSQSDIMNVLLPLLTEEEDAIFKRGRNANSHSIPKNAEIMEYKRATGFEALIGYLYITKQSARIKELLKIATEHISSFKSSK